MIEEEMKKEPAEKILYLECTPKTGQNMLE
jgi:hypothetical protein